MTTLYADSDASVTNEVAYNTGAFGYIAVKRDTQRSPDDGIWRGLIHFDLSAVTGGIALSPVLRVKLIHAYYNATPTAAVLNVYCLRVGFVESEVDWDNRSAGVPWGTAGCGNTTSDYYSTVVGSVDAEDLRGHEEEVFEISLTSSLTKEDLQYGLRLDLSSYVEGESATITWYSRENGTSKAPQLQIAGSVSGDPEAVLGSIASIVADSSSAKQFTVTYSDDTAIDYSSIATGNCTITGPHGYSESATLVSVDVESDGTPRVATYSTPAPSGGWSWLTNGVYTIVLGANEVCDTSTNYIATGTLGTFVCAIASVTTLRYYAYHTPTGEPFDGDAANHTISIVYGSTSAYPWSTSREVDAAGKPGLYEVDLTAAQGAEALLSLYGTSTTANVRIKPLLNIPGPSYTPEVDAVKFAGDANAPGKLVRELNAMATGAVFIDGSHAASTTAFWTTLPLRADGYGNMVLRFDDGDLAGLFCDISIGVTDGSYTKITLATALDTAPANGVLITAGGNKE
jgi:hypothetical protein